MSLAFNLPQANFDFPMYKGDTCKLVFTFTDSGGMPIVLNTNTVLWQFRLKTKDGELLKQVTHLTGASWTASNVLTCNFLQDLPEGTHYHDLQLTSPTGEVLTYYAGKVFVTQDVSKI